MKAITPVIIAVLGVIAGFFGYNIPDEAQKQLAEIIQIGLNLITLIGVVWASVKATKASKEGGFAGLVMLAIVFAGGLALNATTAAKDGRPIEKWRDVKHAVEVSYEGRKPVDYSKMNE